MATYARDVAVISAQREAFLRLPTLRKPLLVLGSLLIGFLIWNIPPSPSLGIAAVHFLATLAVGVVLWVGDVFDDYVVGIMLLMSWVILGIASSKLALAGFAHSSWFFVVAAFGLGAGVNKSGLLHRSAIRLFRKIPRASYTIQNFVLFASGLLVTPLLPTGKARAVIALPISRAIAKANGFADRSNAATAISLAALTGFCHMSFLFLTGGEQCLIGWNLLPLEAKTQFGWTTWILAALPTGILILLFVLMASHFLFPLKAKKNLEQFENETSPALETPGPFTHAEWFALTILGLTLLGWLTEPLHGIGETWVALAGLLAFLTTGQLDKKSFRNDLDWGLIVFFGIINSMAGISQQLKIDRWLGELVAPILADVSANSMAFLTVVVVIVFLTRFFLRKTPTVALMTLTMVPVGQANGIHPGVILLTVLAASECFFLPYQDGPYQIAYSSTDGQAFSHGQARKILGAKFIATICAIALTVPYWKLLGLIQ